MGHMRLSWQVHASELSDATAGVSAGGMTFGETGRDFSPCLGIVYQKLSFFDAVSPAYA